MKSKSSLNGFTRCDIAKYWQRKQAKHRKNKANTSKKKDERQWPHDGIGVPGQPNTLLHLNPPTPLPCLRGRRKGRVAFKRLSRLGQARLRHVFGLRTGALFFFLGGSKGAVLDPPNVLFFAVPEFESCWGSAVSQPCPRRCFCSRISYGAGRQSFYTASIHLSPTLCF